MMGMNANKSTDTLSSPAGFAAALCVFLVLFVSIGIRYLKHKDVHAVTGHGVNSNCMRKGRKSCGCFSLRNPSFSVIINLTEDRPVIITEP